MDPQVFQSLALVAVFGGFAAVEWARGELRPREAGPEDDRLDIAILVMFPLVFAGVLTASTALCAWLILSSATRSRTGRGGRWSARC